jgi:hypothetical protein
VLHFIGHGGLDEGKGQWFVTVFEPASQQTSLDRVIPDESLARASIEECGRQSRGAISEGTAMQAQTKRQHVSDQAAPKVKEGGRGKKGHRPREDEGGKASGSSTAQTPIQRSPGSAVGPQPEESTPSDSDEPVPTPSPTMTPIDCPDDPSTEPIVRRKPTTKRRAS